VVKVLHKDPIMRGVHKEELEPIKRNQNVKNVFTKLLKIDEG
jgi:hypothetical protein